ncbi:MAG TPA: hypothetical protein DD803_15920 [Alcaligenes faecalis]|nr:hypothetical protein [Alcaligenes faecalis]
MGGELQGIDYHPAVLIKLPDQTAVFWQWDLCCRLTKLSRVRQDDGLVHVKVKRCTRVVEHLSQHLGVDK